MPFGTLTTIDESPHRFGVLYVGTDDGLLHVSRDGGETWSEGASGLPYLGNERALTITTSPAPMTAPCPMRTPAVTVTPCPIQTSWPTVTQCSFRQSKNSASSSPKPYIDAR